MLSKLWYMNDFWLVVFEEMAKILHDYPLCHKVSGFHRDRNKLGGSTQETVENVIYDIMAKKYSVNIPVT